MLRKISLASLALVVGGILAVVGFYAYFTDQATLNLAGFFYGIPLLLGGLALKAAELEPVEFTEPTSPEVLLLRESQATDTQNQVRKDITRFRYGQPAHLDDALERLGMAPTDEERPLLQSLREVDIDGAYALILEFYSPLLPIALWEEKQEKIAKFFGPGLDAKVTQKPDDKIELALITSPKA
ncbi:MAG: DUF2854 domain-containing protein [Microcoleus sp. PH2017_40_RAT_O_B]|jgi:hypothetical protein|uniref:DUF2854 domain-containing protein n=1 Tax=unclassified Microcoleus TaxID=2642155 RepID=UPI001D726373|nr:MULTISPECIES: DUF2854 domain-containing protein [unclassified Microcoleus]TAE16798.1 MAG: DUF2854 domain-containing protein [Oscillatoriales cyanobacterium]MCC3572129.1 DUF2854 domain-containing protein [Microcoleus sp. PH2017_34_RAT_O_A]MCC3610151.1 DUF2854 domain-containing protein [Microcoleus sp. PH2017_40_RAT_O_B]TAE28396.1 MAG: DUF2854 domain-containing protein [Oscillatoriales cyanobacterium]TAE50459.1 MAG: DUF2854 domain-containing protein [Oscillatoriales cyanobacterium]